jgi:hypothetical protein
MRIKEKQRWYNRYYYYYSFPVSSREPQATNTGMHDTSNSEVWRVWV